MIFFKIPSLIFLTIIISQTNVYAGVYKCVKKGVVYYNDKPCVAGLKREEMKLGKRSSKKAHNKPLKALDQKPKTFSSADPAMYLNQQEEAMLKKEESVDNGSYEMMAAEKNSLKMIEKLYAKKDAELRKKEAIKMEKAKERNRLAKIEQKKKFRKIQQSVAKQAQYNHIDTIPGSKAYNDRQKARVASKNRKIRQLRAQRKLDKEFRNTRYKGNDIHY